MTEGQNTTIVKNQLAGATNALRVAKSYIEAAAVNCDTSNKKMFVMEAQQLVAKSRQLLFELGILYKDFGRGVTSPVQPTGMGQPAAGFRRPRVFKTSFGQTQESTERHLKGD